MEQLHKPKNTPKDVFLHLLAIAMLYVSVVSVIALLFQYVNALFPDQLEPIFRGSTFSAVRSSLSALIVAWPVYILMMWLIARDIKAVPEKRELGVRKWLVYFTLFIAAITIIVDLITLIHNFLGGELTVKFFLKVLVVLITAGLVFGYYLWDLRTKKEQSQHVPRIWAWVVSGVLLLVIISAFFIIGSPGEQRKIRFDEQRVSDLQTLQSQLVYAHWQQKGTLPQSLNELRDDISGFIPPVDPETGQIYEYTKTGDTSFELCATFSRESLNTSSRPREIYTKPDVFVGEGVFENWNHAAGRVCFERTIDPTLYPPRKE